MMSHYDRPTHQVAITGAAPCVRVALDGHELRACTSAVLRLDASGNPPVLDLSLAVLSATATSLPAHVLLDQPTRAALQAMGWTPPEGDGAQ